MTEIATPAVIQTPADVERMRQSLEAADWMLRQMEARLDALTRENAVLRRHLDAVLASAGE